MKKNKNCLFCRICFFSFLFFGSYSIVNAQQRSPHDLAAWMIAAVPDNDTATINWALKEGGQIDFKRSNYNALTQAIFNKKPDMVKFLLQKGASVDSVNIDGLNALQYAEKMGDPLIIELIKNKLTASTSVRSSKAKEKDTNTDPVFIKKTVLNAGNYIYKVGEKVLHSRDKGKTWEPGVIKEISTNQDLRSAGISPYLVENMSKTDQRYLDTNFITSLTRQTSWTAFFIGDWDLYLPITSVDRQINRDVYTIISGGDRLPPLRINKDGTYSWVIDKEKVIKGKWEVNKDAPGIILISGDKTANWLMYNTTDNQNKKIYKNDYIIISPLSGHSSPKHGFRIHKSK
jgi:hypothetical protein